MDGSLRIGFVDAILDVRFRCQLNFQFVAKYPWKKTSALSGNLATDLFFWYFLEVIGNKQRTLTNNHRSLTAPVFGEGLKMSEYGSAGNSVILRPMWFSSARRQWKRLVGWLGLTASVSAIVGLPTVVSVVGFFWWNSVPATPVVSHYTSDGQLSLNIERRNAVENKLFSDWTAKVQKFMDRYFTSIPPSETECDIFVAEFNDFAEKNLSRQQMKAFNRGRETVELWAPLSKFDSLDVKLRKPALQLSQIEYWLLKFIAENSASASTEIDETSSNPKRSTATFGL